MQKGGVRVQMATESEERKSPSQQVRSRMSTKPKVLVRSHAMREETSPPRAPPSPTSTTTCDNVSPSNKLIPSPNNVSPRLSPSHNGKPMVVLSPPVSRGSSPGPSPTCSSPTSTLTLVPSPSSSINEGSLNATNRLLLVDGDGGEKGMKLSRQSVERTDMIINKETSHACRKKSDRFSCDCSNGNCVQCLKGQERNINNNLSCNVNNNIVGGSNTLTVNRVNMRNKFRQHSSGHSSFDGSLNNSPCLSRNNSSELYTDTLGTDLDEFFAAALNKSVKDRIFLLKIEQTLVDFANDRLRTHCKFPPMSSYQRMFVHRCAAYFGMDHNVEASGKSVVVNKTKNTRIPDVMFEQMFKKSFLYCEEQEPKRLILKRDSNSVEDYSFKSPDRQHSFESRRSKSFEEREEEYEKVKRRIFSREMRDSTSIEEFGWSEVAWSSTESDNSSRFRLQLPNHNNYRHPGRLLKVQSEETNESLRPCVAKSHSFGGYGVSVLTRDDSVSSTHSAGPRLLTKQDSATSSVSWRLSPSSSGYKSQSLLSESITTSPISTPYEPTKPDSIGNDDLAEKRLMWAVTDIHSVPKGSIIINPETGESYKNEDGTIYNYDPTNPPVGVTVEGIVKLPHSPPQQKPIILSSPQKSIINQIPSSPKKPPPPQQQQQRIKAGSPCKKSNFINSSTSPSLPYTPPPIQPNRINCQYAANGDSVPQQIPLYTTGGGGGGSFGAVTQQEAAVPYFQPSPCVVYAPYSVPLAAQYEGRLDTPLSADVPPASSFYVNVSDGSSLNAQQMAYQSPTTTYWSQQPITYYQNATPTTANALLSPHQRYPFPQTGYMPTPYQSNFIPHTTQPAPNQDLLPIYSQQQVQMVYPPPPPQPSQQTPMIYSNPGPLLYTQNPPVYPNPVYTPTPALPPPPPQNLPHYPQSASTPNSCSSSVSNSAYCRQLSDIPLQTVPAATSFNHLAQNLSQLNLGGGGGGGGSQINSNAISNHPHYVQPNKPHFENNRQNKSGGSGSTPKGGKYNNGGRNFANSSSQNSSAGTNSPASTVLAGYSGNVAGGAIYRPAVVDTPPLQPNVPLAYGPNYVQPVLCRQGSNMSTAGMNRSSRSPTPASDICNLDKQRMSLPSSSSLYQGMPYVFQVDNRMMDGRYHQQSNNFKQPAMRNQFNHGSDYNNFNRMHKNRKPRGNNKPNGLPPSGK